MELGENGDLSTNNKRTLAAIPCYNEATSIGSVILKAKRYVDEVLVIDDGSSDDSSEIALYAGASVLKHGKNKGYGAVIQSCFKYARDNNFDVMAIIDGDGQHEADELRTVMKPVMDNNIDISIGSRFVDNNGENIPKYRRFGINVLTKITNAGSRNSNKISDGQSGFRAYSKRAIDSLNPKDNDMGVSAEIIMQGRKKQLSYAEVPISCRYDVEGSTKNPIGHGIGVVLSILKYMEVEHSLLFFGLPGLILFLIGLLFGFNVYFSYYSSGELAIGNALIAIVLIILGVLSGMTGLVLHAVINANRRT